MKNFKGWLGRKMAVYCVAGDVSAAAWEGGLSWHLLANLEDCPPCGHHKVMVDGEGGSFFLRVGIVY